jgi:hypothetical protein
VGQGQYRREDDEAARWRKKRRLQREQLEEQKWKELQEQKRKELERQQAQEQQLAHEKELLENIAKASRNWDDFRRNQDLKSIHEAARTLEEAYLQLENETFWLQFHNLPNRLETEAQKAATEALLRNFDDFLAFEKKVLQDAKLPSSEVVRLLDNVNEAVRDRDRAFRMVRSKPDMDTIGNLRDRFKDLLEALRTVQDEISDALASSEPQVVEDSRRYHWGHVVHKSLLFLSGAALASFNLFLLPQSTPATPSMISGAQTMMQQFPENLWQSVGKEIRSVGESARERIRTWRERRSGSD